MTRKALMLSIGAFFQVIPGVVIKLIYGVFQNFFSVPYFIRADYLIRGSFMA